MPNLKKFAVLVTAAKAAQKYVQENPEKADHYLGRAAEFADKRTKGKYSSQINGAADKARSAALGKNRAVGGDAPKPVTPDDAAGTDGPAGTDPKPQSGSW